MQLALYPAQIRFSEKKKSMFGRVVEDLKDTITLDDKKGQIIDMANRLNQLRIDIVHGLTKLPDLESVKLKVNEARSIFELLYVSFDEAHDDFRLAFHSFKKDTYEDGFGSDE